MALTLLRFVPIRNPFTYLRLLKLRDSYYAGGRFLDHVDNDGFDRRARRLNPLFFFPHSFLRPRAFGLGPGNRLLWPSSSRGLGRLGRLTDAVLRKQRFPGSTERRTGISDWHETDIPRGCLSWRCLLQGPPMHALIVGFGEQRLADCPIFPRKEPQ